MQTTTRADLRHVFDGRVEAIARAIVDQFLIEIPAFRQVPRELLEGPILRVSEACVGIVPTLLAEGRTPTDDEMAPFAASAAQRARDGVPLDLIIRGYQLGIRRCWEETLAAVTIDDPEELRVVTDVFFGLLREVNAIVATAYTDERTAMVGEQQAGRARLFEAVVAGDAAPGTDAATGIRVPAHLVALAVRLGTDGDDGPSAALAARSRLQRLHAAVNHHAGEPVLGPLDRLGGVLLLPTDDTGAGSTPTALDRLVATMADTAGVAVTAASAAGPLAGAGDAVRLATEVLDVAIRFDRPPGHHTLDDVLLEYQWTRPSPATARLAALLDPLDASSTLLETLDAHVRAGLNRRRTAAALHVHPNTVDHRLRRVEATLGVDLRDPSAVHRLAAALAARRALRPLANGLPPAD